MTRLPAILNVINNKCCGTFQARSWIIFHFQGKDSTRAWLAKSSTHRRRNIYVFPILHRLIDQTIPNERYMVVYGLSVSCPIFETKDLFYNGCFDFANSQLCYLDCESTGLKPVMDCKIPFIYIAETQRPRTIMSKTLSIAICYHTNAKTPPCVSVREVHTT